MSYVTIPDMINTHGDDLYDVLHVDVDSDISAHAGLLGFIASANATVDNYLRQRYTIPLASVPSDLATAAGSIAYYFLVSKHRRDVGNETEKSLYDIAMRYLRDLASGTASLSTDDSDVSAAVVEPAAVILGSEVADEDQQGASNSTWFRNW